MQRCWFHPIGYPLGKIQGHHIPPETRCSSRRPRQSKSASACHFHHRLLCVYSHPVRSGFLDLMNILLLSPRFHSPIVPVPFLRNLLLLGLLQTPNLLPVKFSFQLLKLCTKGPPPNPGTEDAVRQFFRTSRRNRLLLSGFCYIIAYKLNFSPPCGERIKEVTYALHRY